mmetsp:Transcript_12195/g.28638  ORF Transcript_12195/g.28638 Transcript_12195/m.28638 type:complete len:254 (+) Transcript_12195:80-841(+)
MQILEQDVSAREQCNSPTSCAADHIQEPHDHQRHSKLRAHNSSAPVRTSHRRPETTPVQHGVQAGRPWSDQIKVNFRRINVLLQPPCTEGTCANGQHPERLQHKSDDQKGHVHALQTLAVHTYSKIASAGINERHGHQHNDHSIQNAPRLAKKDLWTHDIQGKQRFQAETEGNGGLQHFLPNVLMMQQETPVPSPFKDVPNEQEGGHGAAAQAVQDVAPPQAPPEDHVTRPLAHRNVLPLAVAFGGTPTCSNW